MTQKLATQNRPKVHYRVQLEKKIEINKSYSERRNQAIAMRILSYGLFGQKRYQNLYLSCSLNCFYYGLKIANAIHRRVAGLAMIIKFQTAHVIEYYEEPFEGKTYGEKRYSKINIKLTKTPSAEDKNEPGYNPGLNAEDIEQPLTDVITRGGDRGENGQRGRGGYRGRGRFNRGGRRGYNNRRPFNSYRGERQQEDRPDRRQGDRRQGGRDGGRDYGRDRADRADRVDYRQFRSGPRVNNRYEEEEQRGRGERRTRGTYQRGGNDRYQEKNDDDKTFDRRRTNNNERGEDRGNRGPQRKYRDED